MKRLFTALMISICACAGAAAQQAVTSAFEGFSGSGDQPVQIDADKLEVREKDQAAVFSGNVVVRQGASTLRAKLLTILYDNTPQGGAEQPPVNEAAKIGTGRNIRRLEASGGVQVSSGDQKASGDKGVFDLPSNTVVLSGNVVVVQGVNILRGDRLVVDLTTQQSRVESAKGGGRVQGVFGAPPRTPGQ